MQIQYAFGIACALAIAIPVPHMNAQTERGDPDSIRCVRAFPAGMLIPAPPSHLMEPRFGIQKRAETSRMRVEVGAGVDLVEVPLSGDWTARAGVEFFAWALSTSREGLRLQIAAVDGVFGGRITVATGSSSGGVRFRLRLLHLSGHLVDGMYDRTQRRWIGIDEPVPITRDFGELLVSPSVRLSGLVAEPFAGVTRAVLVRPDARSRWGALGGATIRTFSPVANVAGEPVVPYVSAAATLTGHITAMAAINVEAGLRWGTWGMRGMRVFASFYTGPEQFSQFSGSSVRSLSLGFGFEPW